MQTPDIDLNSAKIMLAAAEAHAAILRIRATVVVLDRGGSLVAMTRMDGAWPGAFDLAFGKAMTARAFHAPSSVFAPMIQPGAPLFSVNGVAGGKYVILGGGLPVEEGGQVAGAIGVSGGTLEQDAAIAQAGLAAYTQSNEEKDRQ